jgi:transcriptional regulator with XRE-family HTH domain
MQPASRAASAQRRAHTWRGRATRASPPPPSEETVALTTASLRGDSPVLEARTRLGLRRDEVIAALGLDRAKRGKVSRYYEELETGLRESARLDRRLLDALAGTLRASLSDLLGWVVAPPRPEFTTFFAAREMPAPEPAAAAAPPSAAPARRARAEGPDEIDRLFGAS